MVDHSSAAAHPSAVFAPAPQAGGISAGHLDHLDLSTLSTGPPSASLMHRPANLTGATTGTAPTSGLSVISKAPRSGASFSLTDLTAYIQQKIADNATGSYTLPAASIGGFLEVDGATVDFSTPGTVAINVTSGKIFPGAQNTFAITAGAGATYGLAGSYTIATHAYALTLDQVDLNAEGIITAHTANVAIQYDPTGASGQTIATVDNLTVALPALEGVSGAVNKLIIRSDGFSIGDVSVSVPSLTLMNALSLDNVTLSFAGVNEKASTDSLLGSITISAGAARLFAGQSSFSSTVTGFSGTYDLPNKALHLTATSAAIQFAGTVNVNATSLSFVLDRAAGTFEVEIGLAEVEIDHFVTLVGGLHMESGRQVSIASVGSSTKRTMSVVSLGATNAHAFFGVGGPYWQDNSGPNGAPDGVIDSYDTPDPTNSYGIALGDMNVGMALLTPTAAGDTATDFALKATAGSVVGVFPDVNAAISATALSLSVNGSRNANPSVATPAPVADFSSLPGGGLTVGNVTLDQSQKIFQAAGTATVRIGDFASVTGSLAFSRTVLPTVALTDGASTNPATETLTDAELITVGGRNASGFIGLDGGTNHAFGMAVNVDSFALAMIKSADPTDDRNWAAFTGSVSNAQSQAASAVPFSISGSSLSVAENLRSHDGKFVDFSQLPGGSLSVPTGTGTTLSLAYNTPIAQASGVLNLTVDNFATLTNVAFSLTKSSLDTVNLSNGSATEVLTDATLLTIGISGANAFVGINAGSSEAIGFNVSVGSLAVAIINSGDRTDARVWVALASTGSGATFVAPSGLPVSMSATNLALQINTRSTDGKYVDFTQLPGGALTVPTGPSTTADVDFSRAFSQVAGTVDATVGGLLSLTGVNLALSRGSLASATVTDGSISEVLSNPSLLTFGLSGGAGFIGLNGGTAQAVGFAVSVNSLALAIVKPADRTDRRSWSAVAGSLSNASFVAPADLPVTITGSNLEVDENLVSSDGKFLDFTKLPGGGLSVPTGPTTAQTINFGSAVNQAAGTVSLAVAGFVTLDNVNFVVARSTLPSVTLNDGTTLNNASVLTLGVSGATGFVGINGGTTQAVGFTARVDSLALAVVKGGSGGDARSFVALSASLSNSGFTAPADVPVTATAASLDVDLNLKASDGRYLDFTQFTGGGLTVPTSLATSRTLGESTPVTRVSGVGSVGVNGFVSLTNVGFAFNKSTLASVNVTGGTGPQTLTNAVLLTLGINGGAAFVGVNGGTDQAVGFAVAVNSLALALIKPADKNDKRSWAALTADVANASFTAPSGVPLTATASNLLVDLNTRARDGSYLDFTQFPGGKLTVPTSPTTSRDIAETGVVTRVAGTASLGVNGFVSLTNVNFALNKSSVDGVAVTDGSGAAPQILNGASLLTIGVSGATGFVGVNGGTVDAVGFSATVDSFAFSLIKPADSTDKRTWITVAASVSHAGFIAPAGLPLTLTGSNLQVNENLKASDGTFVDYSQFPGGSLAVATGPSSSIALSYNTPINQAAGTLSLGVGGFVALNNVSFVLSKSTLSGVTLSDGSTLNNASALTLGLSGADGFIGINAGTAQAVGFSAHLDSLALAVIMPTDPTDHRQWVGLVGSVSSASFVAPSGLPVTVSASSLNLDVNTKAADGTTVDFTKFSGGSLTVPTSLSSSAALAESGPAIRVSGVVNLAIDSFVTLNDVGFSLNKSTIDGVAVTNGTTTNVLNGASLLTFGLSGANAFVGINAGTDQAVGFAVSVNSFALAIIKPADPTDARSWVAVSGNVGNVSFLPPAGLPITVQATSLTLDVNKRASDGTYVDFTQLAGGGLAVPTGPSSSQTIAESGPVTRIGGSLTLQIDQFVSVMGTFAVQKVSNVNVTPAGGSPIAANILQVAATNVYAFVGVNGPYWVFNADGSVRAPQSNESVSATGLALGNVAFSFALIKPVDPASKTTYYALGATAGSVGLVPQSGVTLSATNLAVSINRVSSSPGAASSPAVLDFAASFPASGGSPAGLSILPGAPVLNYSQPTFDASANLALGFAGVSVTTFASFSTTTLDNGAGAVKIAASNLSFVLGDPASPIISLNITTGLLLLSRQGVAGMISTPLNLAIPAGSPAFRLNGNVQFEFNTSKFAVNQTFQTDSNGGTQTLTLPAGPYLRLEGNPLTLSFANSSDGGSLVGISGNFLFEQVTNPANGRKQVRIAANGLSIGSPFQDAVVGPVTLSSGSGGMILDSTGVAGVISGAFAFNPTGGISVGSTVSLAINTTGSDVDQTISLATGDIRVNVPAHTFGLTLSNASVNILDIVTLTGDFTIQKVKDANGNLIKTLYGASGVQLFLGSGPARLADGSINPKAIGVLVTNASIGVVRYPGTPSDTWAVTAFGQASLLGIPGVTVGGNVLVRINTSGKTVNESITLPGSNAASVPVVYTSSTRVLEFDAGYHQDGTPASSAADGLFSISAGGIVTLSGAASFTLSPTKRLTVYIPTAAVDINIPDGNGGLMQVFEIKGSAQFSMGGGQGFQLQDLRVNGFSVFGSSLLSIATPATAMRPPTTALSDPADGTVLDVNALNARHYIDVVYNDINHVGLNATSIRNGSTKFLVTGGAASGVVFSQVPTLADPNDPTVYRFTFTGQFNVDAANPANNVIQIKFQPGTFSDVSGATNGGSVESFTLYDATQGAAPAPPISPSLTSPMNGQEVAAGTMDGRGYIDVTFNIPGGGIIPAGALTGNEIKLSGPGAANLALAANGAPEVLINGSLQVVAPTLLSGTTYRYYVSPGGSRPASQMFAAGAVFVTFVGQSISVQQVDANGNPTGPAVPTAVEAGQEQFTVSTTNTDAGTTSQSVKLGPISLSGPSISLAKFGFQDGKLLVTVAIGVGAAGLAFGGSQSGTGISASLTDLVGKFDVAIDLSKLTTSFASAFSIPGSFSLSVGSLDVNVPDVVRLTATGIQIAYDPAYNGAKALAADPATPQHNGTPHQRILVVNSATLSFEKFHIEGSISPTVGNNGQVIPGLTIWDDGFTLGQAQLSYTAGVSLGSILTFNDLRVGVTNFDVQFGQAVTFNGTIYFATGGATLFPGKPISASLSTSTPGAEAFRITLSFANGHVQSLKFTVDTFKIQFSSFVTFTGRRIFIDTGAAYNQPVVKVGSIGAAVKAGPLSLSGTVYNFEFLGNGQFVALPGFGVILKVGSSTGDSFGWPSWLPVELNEIGIQWTGDIATHPADFVITLGAKVKAIKGIPGLTFSGGIEGVQIDVGKLIRGEFPIVGIESITVSVSGTLFGGKISAGLIGGILKVDADGNKIDASDFTTPVARRIFFMGLQGQFSFSGVGGFTIRLALSELGPLGVFISVEIPNGVLVEPNSGLTINDFAAGVDFFSTLPSITNPLDLRGAAFDLPKVTSAEDWLPSVEQQVINQAKAVAKNPNLGGFLAAFISPMVITGGGKIYTSYASEETFNGQVIIKFSTDGKFMVAGKLNFLDNQVSVAAKLYADLSGVFQGKVTVLFLADIPDQVKVLTIDGSLRTGFKDVAGRPVFFSTIEPDRVRPTATLVSPRAGGVTSISYLQGKGYADVTFPNSPFGDGSTHYSLPSSAVLNATSKIVVVPTAGGSSIALDTTQTPIQIGGTDSLTYRFWLKNVTAADVAHAPSFKVIAQSLGYIDLANGKTIFNTYGVTINASGQAVNGNVAPNNLLALVVDRPYIDLKFLATTATPTPTIDLSQLALQAQTVVQITGVGGAQVPIVDAVSLNDGQTVRFFFGDHTSFASGVYTVAVPGNIFRDSSSAAPNNAGSSTTFTVSNPSASVAGPFAPSSPTSDVNALNAALDVSGKYYIDVNMLPASGGNLDYATILNPAAPLVQLYAGASASGTPIGLSLQPIPITMAADPNTGVLTPTAVNYTLGDPSLNTTLAQARVTRFRYLITDPAFTAFGTGPYTVKIASGWKDTAGNVAPTDVETFTVQGPYASIADPLPGATFDVSTLNSRHYVDVAFYPAGGETIDPTTITTALLSFPGSGVSIDTAQAPTKQADSPLTYRFFFTGSFAPGSVTVRFAAGLIGDNESTLKNLASTQTFTAGGPTVTLLSPGNGRTIGLDQVNGQGYIDVAFNPTDGDSIDLSTIQASMILVGGPGAGTVKFTAAPTQLTDQPTYRFPFVGKFAPGVVTIEFAANSFHAIAAPGDPSPIGNLDQLVSFTAVQLTATLADPMNGDTVDINQINYRSYFDVTYVVPSYASTLDVASIAADGPQFAVAAPGGGSFALDTDKAPALVGSSTDANGHATYTFRYWYLGTVLSGSIGLTFKGGSLQYLDAAGQTIPLFADQTATVGQTGSTTYVDVSFGSSLGLDASSITTSSISIPGATIRSVSPQGAVGTYRFVVTGVASGQSVTVHFAAGGWTYNGGMPSVVQGNGTAALTGANYIDVKFFTYGSDIDPASLIGHEFTLGGAGQGVQIGAHPALLGRGNGYEVFRYSLTKASGTTQTFQGNGTVTIAFLPATWSDFNGNVSAASQERFQLITRGPPPGQRDTVHQAFFIEVTGDVRLNDPTGFISGDNPLLNIRGKASLTFDVQDSGPIFSLDASGTVVVYRIGNLASGAAHFVFDMSAGFSAPPKIYGALAIASNLDFLKSLGITVDASALLEINLTGEIQTVKLSLEGIPGDKLFDSYDAALLANPSALGSAVFGSVALPQVWLDAFKTNGVTLNDTAPYAVLTVKDLDGTPIQWTVHDGDKGAQYFIRYKAADAAAGTGPHFEVDGEIRTLLLQPFTFLIELYGRAVIANPTQPTGDPWFSLKGGFEIQISPNGFEFFAVANLEMSSTSAVRILLLAVNPALAFVNQISATTFFVINSQGLAGYLRLSFGASFGGSNFGLNDQNGNVSVSGTFKLVFNTIQRDFRYAVPKVFVPYLSSLDSPVIDLPASPAPVISLYTEANSNVASNIFNQLPGSVGGKGTIPAALVALFQNAAGVNIGSNATVEALVANADDTPLVLEWRVSDGVKTYTIIRDIAAGKALPKLQIWQGKDRYVVEDKTAVDGYLADLPTALNAYGAVPQSIQTLFATSFQHALHGTALIGAVTMGDSGPVEWLVNDSTGGVNRIYLIQLLDLNPNRPGTQLNLAVSQVDSAIYLQLRINGELNLFNVLTLKGELSFTAQVVTTGPPTNKILYTQLQVTGQIRVDIPILGTGEGLVDFTIKLGKTRANRGFWGSVDLKLQTVPGALLEFKAELKLLVNISGTTQSLLQYVTLPNGQTVPQLKPFDPGLRLELSGLAIIHNPFNYNGTPVISLKGYFLFQITPYALDLDLEGSVSVMNLANPNGPPLFSFDVSLPIHIALGGIYINYQGTLPVVSNGRTVMTLSGSLLLIVNQTDGLVAQTSGRITINDPTSSDPNAQPWFVISGAAEFQLNLDGMVFFATAHLDMSTGSVFRYALGVMFPPLAAVNQINVTTLFSVSFDDGIAGMFTINVGASAGLSNLGLSFPNAEFSGSSTLKLQFNSQLKDVRYAIPDVFLDKLSPNTPTFIDVPGSPQALFSLYANPNAADAAQYLNALPNTVGVAVPVPAVIAALFAGAVGRPLGAGATVQGLVANQSGVTLEWLVLDGSKGYIIQRDLSNPQAPTIRIEDAPSATPSVYFQLSLSGDMNLFNQLTLHGEFAFTIQIVVDPNSGNPTGLQGEMFGQVTVNLPVLGQAAGLIDFGFAIGGTTGFWGAVSLSLVSAPSLPGVAFQGEFNLLVNVSNSPQNLPTFVADPTTGNVTIQVVSFAPGFEVQLSGHLKVLDILDFKGAFDFAFTFSPASVTIKANAALILSPIGGIAVGGYLRLDASGIVTHLTASLDAGANFGGGVGIRLTGSVLIDVNTTGQSATFTDAFGVSHTVAPGFLLTISGSVDFLGFARASGTITLSITSNAFQFGFDVDFNLAGGLFFHANGYAGVFNDSSPGLALQLGVSFGVNVAGIFKINAGGLLNINTTGLNRNGIGPHSFYLNVNGTVSILELFQFGASFTVTVGPYVTAINSSFGSFPVSLGYGGWSVQVSASMSFLGIATVSADIFLDSNGDFHLYLGGGFSFGAIPWFGFQASFHGEILVYNDPISGDVDLGVDIGGSGAAYVIGIGVGASFGVRGFAANGSFSIVVSGSVSIGFWIFTIHIPFSFYIGTIQLPSPVHLAGDAGDPYTWNQSNDGTLYLNVGDRAYARGVGQGATTESYTIDHVSGDANGETIRITSFGRSQTFNGVKRIVGVGNGSTSQQVTVHQGVVVPISIQGGSASPNTFVSDGSGPVVFVGGPYNDTLIAGDTVPAAVLDGRGGDDYLKYTGSGRALIAGGDGRNTIIDSGIASALMGHGQVNSWNASQIARDMAGGVNWINDGAAVSFTQALSGVSGSTIIEGNGGDDWINAGPGDNLIALKLNPIAYSHTIVGGPDNTNLWIFGYQGLNNPFVANPSAGAVSLTDGPASLTASNVRTLTLQAGSATNSFTIGNLASVGVRHVVIDSGAGRTTAATVSLTGNTAAENFRLAAGDPVNGAMSSLYITGTDAASGQLVTDYRIVNARRSLGDSLTLNGGAGPNVIDASNLGGPAKTVLPTSTVYPDFTQLILIGGSAGGNTIIASPFNDTLDVGPGPNNTVVIQRGLYNFVVPASAVNNTLVVNTDVDVALYNDTVVMGQLLADTGSSPYNQLEAYPAESTIGNAAYTQNSQSFPPVSRGRRFAAGATVENIKNIFTNAIINRSPANGVIVVDGFFNTVTVGSQTLNTTPWKGKSVTINSVADPGGRIQRDIIDLAQDANVSTAFTINGVGPEVLQVYGTPAVDIFTMGSAVAGGVTSGTIAVSGSSTSTISYNGLNRVLIQTLAGNDGYTINNVVVPTVLNLGAGNNTLTIGADPTVNPGTSAPLYVFAGGGSNTMTISHNRAPIWISGGAGNNTYTVNASADTNGPIFLNAGTGTDSLVENGLPTNDTFAITSDTIAGAGRSITFTKLEAITVNDNGGSDAFWIMNVNPNTTMTIGAQSGSDTINVQGVVPAVSYTPPSYSAMPVASTTTPPATVYTPRVLDLGGLSFTVRADEWGNTLASYGNDTNAAALYYINRYLDSFLPAWTALYPAFSQTSRTIQNITVTAGFDFPSYGAYDRYQQITAGTLLIGYQTGVGQSLPRTNQADPATFQPPTYTYQAPVSHLSANIAGLLTILGGSGPNNATTWNFDDTGNTAATSSTLTDGKLTGLSLSPAGIVYSGVNTATFNLGSGANSLAISVAAGKNLPPTTYINGGANAANVITTAAWATDQNGVLDITGFPAITSMTIGGNLNGQIAVDRNPSPTYSLTQAPTYTANPNTIANAAVTGSVTAAGFLYTQNITTMTVGQNMAGLIDVTNNLTTLTINGASPGQITADGAIGTVWAKAVTGAQALKIREAGVARIVEAPPVAANGVSPTFNAYYQSSLSGLAVPTLALTQTSANAGAYDLSLSVYQDKVNTAALQFVPPTYTITGRWMQPKFNLAIFNAPAATGVRTIAVSGDLITTVSAPALAALGLAAGTTGGIKATQDALGGVAVRDYAAPNSVLARSLQSIAFGQFTRAGVKYTNNDPTVPQAQRTIATAQDAYSILNVNTAKAPAATTYSVPVGQYPVVQYLTTTANNVLDANYLLFSNQYANDPSAAANGLLPNATVLANVGTTWNGTKSSISSVSFVGDGGSLMTAQPIAGPITSTGPIGDLTLAASTGLTGAVTAPRIFGSIVTSSGPIAATAVIQTTGRRTDPITGAVTAVNADFGQISLVNGVWTTTTINGRGLIAGKIISRGNLVSQVVTDGNMTGLVAAVGDIGGVQQAGTTQPARFGGMAITGSITGQVITLRNILGNVTATNLAGGRIAALGSILGNLTITTTFDANSVVLAGGQIGDATAGTGLNLTNPSGIIAAKGAVRFTKTTSLTAASVFSNLTGTDANTAATVAAVNGVFADGSGNALSGFDSTGVDYALLTNFLTKNLAKLRTTTGTGGVKILSLA